MEKALKGQTAVITGAGSGIGRAAALKLAEYGARVALLDLKEENIAEVKQQITEMGSEAMIIEADVSKAEDVEAAFGQVASKWGHVGVVFANAGINGVVAPIEDISPDDWDDTLETNLKGTFLTVKYAIPHMKEIGGSIIITSSINGNRVFKNWGMSAYSSSKAGQVAFGKMAALELAQYGIRVNIICPGAIDTNIDQNTFKKEEQLKEIMIPIEYPEGNQPLEQGSGKAGQVADLVLFLASGQSSHISGTEIYIDGVESLIF
ncbi:SDR family oxidoreductase [Mesobacillus foraminis]|uniref:SDR family oxidoreductase n=1 Tax=Mesobacillus foraminis TaxID=279826 RepID=UPI001BE96F93|nr:SDR family NAD(P)-dependent oxidoreductase [Mesobacillus foraminis]MBT2758229.1 SDR family oxidoreductase [Mesobacillus foraminis]